MNIVIIGATSLIAQETARLLASRKQDTHFLLVARQTQRLEMLGVDLKVRGAKEVVYYGYDALQYKGLGVVDFIKKTFTEVDLVLIAHGVLGQQDQLEIDFTALENLYFTNLLSCVFLLNALVPIFEKQRKGSLVVLSSVAGDRGRRANYYYGSTKAALTALMQGIRVRLATSGVHVLTVKPGMVDTPMTMHMKKNILFASPQKVASGIICALESKKDVVYLPRFWAFIMFVLRLLPESFFKRLGL